ncbi:unnamed protein product [Pseudo-nitzschia multistriata]|uniref:Uncharacterized protein n=1 Tax=Pseudo-nitzschia multistriata TaxID=183589 RepID=A0A448ZGJ0_9STRA|nr:unnamed protein product [Pseudo-nitzschia multistriata]
MEGHSDLIISRMRSLATPSSFHSMARKAGMYTGEKTNSSQNVRCKTRDIDLPGTARLMNWYHWCRTGATNVAFNKAKRPICARFNSKGSPLGSCSSCCVGLSACFLSHSSRRCCRSCSCVIFCARAFPSDEIRAADMHFVVIGCVSSFFEYQSNPERKEKRKLFPDADELPAASAFAENNRRPKPWSVFFFGWTETGSWRCDAMLAIVTACSLAYKRDDPGMSIRPRENTFCMLVVRMFK